MLERHVIVSGTDAGRPGPLRATSGCACEPCATWRDQRNEQLRERYAADDAYRQHLLDLGAERRLEHGEAISAAERERYLTDPAYAEAKRASARAWSHRNAERKRAAARARYRRL